MNTVALVISAETLGELLREKYRDLPPDLKIIDIRKPSWNQNVFAFVAVSNEFPYVKDFSIMGEAALDMSGVVTHVHGWGKQ